KIQLNTCSLKRAACESDINACKSQLAKITAKPDEIVTELVRGEKLLQENQDLQRRLDDAVRKLAGIKYMEDKKADPARMHAALELLDGFERERGTSVSG